MLATDKTGTKRISFAFFVIIVVLVTITMSGLSRIQHVVAQFDRVVDTHNVEVRIMNQIMKVARDRSLLLQGMLLSRDPFLWNEQQMQLSELNTRYTDLRAQLLALEMEEDDLQILERQREQTARTGAFQSQVSQLIVDEAYERANLLFFEAVIPNQARAIEIMEQFVDHLQQDIAYEQETVRDQVAYYNELMWFLLALGVGVSVVIAMTVIHWLRREITRRDLIETELEERVKSRTQRLAHMATHDTLTKLPNRNLFNAQLVQTIKRSHRQQNFTALFFMDLDGFKEINDRHGHDAGDKVLIETSHRINDTIRDEDIFSRIGGDEFTIILGNLESPQVVLPIADKIITAVNQPIELEDHQLHLGISIGISFFPLDGETMDTLITRADDAMYKAKRSGKNHYVTASPIPHAALPS